MSTDNQESETGIGFYLRRFTLLVVLLLASRGAIEVVSGGNRLAGVLVIIAVSIVGGWLLLRYEDSYFGE
jgi:hypothetical protein